MGGGGRALGLERTPTCRDPRQPEGARAAGEHSFLEVKGPGAVM